MNFLEIRFHKKNKILINTNNLHQQILLRSNTVLNVRVSNFFSEILHKLRNTNKMEQLMLNIPLAHSLKRQHDKIIGFKLKHFPRCNKRIAILPLLFSCEFSMSSSNLIGINNLILFLYLLISSYLENIQILYCTFAIPRIIFATIKMLVRLFWQPFSNANKIF